MKKVVGTLVVLVILAVVFFFFFMQPRVDLSQFEYLKEPQISSKPDQKTLVVEATGDPSLVAPDAFGLLFKTYYGLKGVPKGRSQPPPRARWPLPFETPRSEWIGLYGMPLPGDAGELPGTDADAEMKVSITTWEYGEVVEILHVGPYDKEQPTIKRLKDFIAGQGYEIAGPHEEEYLKGPTMFSKGNPEEYVTILRYRVKKQDESAQVE